MTPPPAPEPKRILYVDFAPSPGGSILSLTQILEHLPRRRYQPLALLSPTVGDWPRLRNLDIPIFTFDARQGTPYDFRPAARQVRESGAAGRMRDNKWLSRPWRWISIARRLWVRTRPTISFIAKLIAAQDIDLIHMNDALPLAEPGILAAWRTRRPSIVTVRSFTPIDDLHRRISRLPAAGVFTSGPLQQNQRAQGARFREERVIFNAIDTQQFEAEPDRAGVRAGFGLDPHARIVCVAGRLMRRKGLDVFIRALAELIPAFPDLHGFIIGAVEITDIGLDDELKALAADLGIANHIHLTGHRDDIPRLLLSSDLLSFVPTEPEPFGRVLVEAMAAGLPVVGARSGAIPDIMIEGETGLLVPAADPAPQAQAIGAILSDPPRAQAMGFAGRRRATERFGIDRQIADLCALYGDVLR